MMSVRSIFAVICTTVLCCACATVPKAPTGTVEMRLLPGQSPVVEVEGPYAVYSRVGHGVTLRIWPDSVEDGRVDLSIIVRNTEIDTIHLSSADVVARGETGPLAVAGENEMLARFDAAPDRRNRSPATFGALDTFGGGSIYDGNLTAGVVVLEAPTRTGSVARGSDPDNRADDDTSQTQLQTERERIADWYLGSLDIEAGQTAVGSVRVALPETSQTIMVNVDVDSEYHEFALVFERLP